MDEWLDEWLDEWIDDWIIEWIIEWMINWESITIVSKSTVQQIINQYFQQANNK
jgi:hypothetical protein